MLIETFIGADNGEHSDFFENGINIIFQRVTIADEVCVKIQCHGDKPIIHEFTIEYEELKKAVVALGVLS